MLRQGVICTSQGLHLCFTRAARMLHRYVHTLRSDRASRIMLRLIFRSAHVDCGSALTVNPATLKSIKQVRSVEMGVRGGH